jgi:hypothetical protein
MEANLAVDSPALPSDVGGQMIGEVADHLLDGN